jgi:hypothetical protein
MVILTVIMNISCIDGLKLEFDYQSVLVNISFYPGNSTQLFSTV